jgi:hypothetical protein
VEISAGDGRSRRGKGLQGSGRQTAGVWGVGDQVWEGPWGLRSRSLMLQRSSGIREPGSSAEESFVDWEAGLWLLE